MVGGGPDVMERGGHIPGVSTDTASHNHCDGISNGYGISNGAMSRAQQVCTHGP